MLIYVTDVFLGKGFFFFFEKIADMVKLGRIELITAILEA